MPGFYTTVLLPVAITGLVCVIYGAAKLVEHLHSCVSIARRHQWSHLCDEKGCNGEEVPIVVNQHEF